MLSTDDLCARFSKMATPLNGVNGGSLPVAGTVESEEVRCVQSLCQGPKENGVGVFIACSQWESAFDKLVSKFQAHFR